MIHPRKDPHALEIPNPPEFPAEIPNPTVIDFEAVEGRGAAGRLVRDHAAKDAPEDLGRLTVVKRTVGGVHVAAQAFEGGVLELLAEQRVGDVNLLAAHNGDLLAAEELLGNDGRQAALEVAAAINDQLLLKRRHFGRLSVCDVRSRRSLVVR